MTRAWAGLVCVVLVLVLMMAMAMAAVRCWQDRLDVRAAGWRRRWLISMRSRTAMLSSRYSRQDGKEGVLTTCCLLSYFPLTRRGGGTAPL
jgi:hypothetical protein